VRCCCAAVRAASAARARAHADSLTTPPEIGERAAAAPSPVRGGRECRRLQLPG
jgi:hypothetical protein